MSWFIFLQIGSGFVWLFLFNYLQLIECNSNTENWKLLQLPLSS